MEDKDIQRVEERIEVAEDRWRLGLELAISKVEARLDAPAMELRNSKEVLSTATRELRTDLRELCTELGARDRELRTENRAHHRELRTIVLGTSLAVMFGVAATGIGLPKVWIGGMQAGLGQSSPAHAAPAN